VQVLEWAGDHCVQVAGMAQSAIAGMDLVNQLTPTGVIVDLRLPCPSGLAAICLMRAAHPDLAIVALNEAESRPMRAAARVAGADEFVTKDRVHEALLPALERATAAHEVKTR
jgi:DNA-binding NarL/FixJ family response regulator